MGRKVRKELSGGCGFCTGTVRSYDAGTGFFEIVYEDGNSEELDWSGIISLLYEPVEVADAGDHLEPSAKKRRCLDESSGSGNRGSSLDLSEAGGLDLNVNVTAGFSTGMESNCVENEELDLNKGVMSDDSEMDCSTREGEGLKGRGGCIDLNLDVTEGENLHESFEIYGKSRPFDLNLGFEEENKACFSGNGEGQFGGSPYGGDQRVGNNVKEEEEADLANFQNNVIEGTQSEETRCPVLVREETNDASLIEVELKDSYDNNLGLIGLDPDSASVPGSAPKRRRGRKRKVIINSASNADVGASNTDVGTVLRRSTRRTKRAAVPDEDNGISAVVVLEPESSFLASPVINGVCEQEMMEVVTGEGLSGEPVLPPKRELPSSSENLDLQGMSALDVFSVYSFLRSFSTLLFLSPFELEDFIASLTSNEPTILFDSIHVSVLRTLRKHLQSLSDDSSETALNCLRSLDWGLLDLTTWPIFLAEYLLMHSCGLRPDFDLCHLKLVESDYYSQPASIKIEILHCLCDDAIEVEAIRSELNRRTLATEGLEGTKKRKATMEVASGSCLTEEDNDESPDWNSDECCLCKMDGNLICCDGCPAAFHSRCVGVCSSLLPEGDWYCPECVIDKDKPTMKVWKSIRGAKLLGIDVHGRLYYSSCGYLLVLEDCGGQTLFNYYHIDDFPTVIDALKLSGTSYEAIIAEISKKWSGSSQFGAVKYESHTQSRVTVTSERHSSISAMRSRRSNNRFKVTALDDGRVEDKSAVTGHTKSEVTDSVGMISESANCTVNNGNLFLSSEGSTEVSQTLNGSNGSACPASESEIPGDFINMVDSASCIAIEMTSTNSMKHGGLSSRMKDNTMADVQHLAAYVNYYNFAQIAAAVAEDFMSKPISKNPEAIKSVEEVISDQLKSILTKCTQFSFPSLPCSSADVRIEKCGWCFSCKSPEYERECLIAMIDSGLAVENFASEVLGGCTRKHRKGHFIDVLCLIGSIEARLHGLLLGPWLDPHFSQLWCKSLLRTSDIEILKCLLLKLESNLSRLALSAAWMKHVDSAGTMGSGILFEINFIRGSSRSGTSRKRARVPELETTITTKSTSELSSYWWRGGRLSRQLFNWRVLPRSLASRAARQAGCKKIPGILYPDGSEFPTRSKCVAWRADVESSRSVEQLALHVKQLYANIRWDVIENTNLSLQLDKDPKKPFRSFKKAIIRRKCIEGTIVKYLLDFGKRRFIPDIVVKKGFKVEDGSSEKKKYWLEECHVPLYLLKAFEERRIARKPTKLNPGKLSDFESALKRSLKKKGFAYLFSRAEKSEYYQCGHCCKDVLIREAVTCQNCKEFFHKRHVKKSAGAISSECAYTCHICSGRKIVKPVPKKEKWVSGKRKKGPQGMKLRSKSRKELGKTKKAVQTKKKKKDSVVVPLRRSPRKLKCLSLENKKVRVQKRGKQRKSNKATRKKESINSWQKKRTRFSFTYWLNGLCITKKPDDEKIKQFRAQNKVFLCGESTSLVNKPRCSLCCEQEFCAELNYVACQICGDWFHGNAFDPRGENICRLVGFKCHKCLKKNPPLCPHFDAGRKESEVVGSHSDTAAKVLIDERSREPAIQSTSIKIDLHLNFESQSLSTAAENGKLQKPGMFSDSAEALPLVADNGGFPSSSEQNTEVGVDLPGKNTANLDGFFPSNMTS